MTVNPIARTLRAKIVGALIREARLAAGKQIEECAQAIGVTNETFEAYELGEQSPSLPELEGMAFDLEIPLEYFWENKPFSSEDRVKKQPNMPQLVAIRNRMIGALIRQARQEANLSLEELTEQTGLPAAMLEAYELGEKPIPVPELETLSGALHRSIREFQDRHGPVGVWITQRQALQDFQRLPVELQEFVSKPVHRPYLELAQRLSEMSVDKLRAVAEGLLEITL